MLNQYGRLNASDYTKKSAPILIPIKREVPDNYDNYDNYINIIPKYGSHESRHDTIKHNLRKDISVKCSESSDFPNQPFGKSPPNKKYIASIYLNIIAEKNLKQSFTDN